VNGFAVPVASPLHCTKRQPFAGVAVSDTGVPESNVPSVGLIEPSPITEDVKVYWATKFAVNDKFPFIVMATGFSEPEASPDQCEKRYPTAGVAVSVNGVPVS